MTRLRSGLFLFESVVFHPDNPEPSDNSHRPIMLVFLVKTLLSFILQKQTAQANGQQTFPVKHALPLLPL